MIEIKLTKTEKGVSNMLKKIFRISSFITIFTIWCSSESWSMEKSYLFDVEAHPNAVKKLGGAPLTIRIGLENDTFRECKLTKPTSGSSWMFYVPNVSREDRVKDIIIYPGDNNKSPAVFDLEKIHRDKLPKAEILDELKLDLNGKLGLRFN